LKTEQSGLSRIDYDVVEADGPLPPFDADSMRADVKRGLEDIREFVSTDEVLNLLDHVYGLPMDDRDEFVRTVVLDEAVLAEKWGIVPPPGIKLQRSQFGDGRPTIFCVVRVLADGIRKVTFTFDSSSAYVLR
jgi:hypothetical protein